MLLNADGLLDLFPGVLLFTSTELLPTAMEVRGCPEDLLGVSAAELRSEGTGWRGNIHPIDRHRVETVVSTAIGSRQCWDVEYRYVARGEEIWLRESGRFAESSGHSDSLLISLLDITSYHQQLTSAAREVDRVKAESERRSEFFASMNHEIRTPMNGVMGMTQILAKTKLDSEQRQYVTTIFESSKALVTIINDILDFSKIEAGKLSLAPAKIDLEKVAYDACHLLATRADEKRLAILLNYRECFPRNVIADGGRLRQILLNLLGNAIKFTRDGHVLLEVKCDSIQPDCADFEFRVTDTGIGIGVEAQRNLFAAYAQADATIANQFGGTGLGLQICKRLVELMGGNIGVESTPGKGSTFWFRVRLPIVPETAGSFSVDLRGKRVLVVDDNPVSIKIYSDYLRDAGAEVVAITDAEEALARLSVEDPFACAILEKNTRGVDGLQLAQLISTSEQHRQAAIILLTSVTEKINKTALKRAGVNAYFNKPASCNLLYQTLGKLLQTPHLTRESLFVANDELTGKNWSGGQAIKLNGKLLVAEDMEINQAVLRAMLVAMGLFVDFANNGEEAVAMWRDGDYDLVLMDCLMPKLDGYAATRAIRSGRSEKAQIPIVALTGNASDVDKQRCFAAGMNDFITKPFIESALVATLAKWLPTENISTTAPIQESEVQAEDDVLNVETFNKLRGLMKEKFIGFAETLMVKLDERCVEIQRALESGNVQAAGHSAHALKGLAGMTGMNRVGDHAAQIEQAGEDEDVTKAMLLLAGLKRAAGDAQRAVKDALHEELNQQVVLF